MSKTHKIQKIFFFFWVLCQPICGAAETVQDAHFTAAASAFNVPPEWTKAIAEVESGGNAFALNIAGKSCQFATKEQALQAAKKAQEAGLSFDSGVMQVNSWWLEKLGLPVSAALDPEANIYLGSWILRQEIEQVGQNWSAVGRYHSPDSVRANEYVEMVKKALKNHSKKKKRIPQAIQNKPIQTNTYAPIVVYRGKASQERHTKKINLSVMQEEGNMEEEK